MPYQECDDLKTPGGRLRSLRNEFGFSLQKLSKKISIDDHSVSSSKISDFEHGREPITDNMAARICEKAFPGVNPAWLVCKSKVKYFSQLENLEAAIKKERQATYTVLDCYSRFAEMVTALGYTTSTGEDENGDPVVFIKAPDGRVKQVHKPSWDAIFNSALQFVDFSIDRLFLRGFNADEDVEFYLECGHEIRFQYEGKVYKIDGLTVSEFGSDELLVDGEDGRSIKEFLEMPFMGKTVRKILDESRITHIH